jgi:integrase/recombinase XerC
MRLSALIEDGFINFLHVEKEATPRTIQTYRYCLIDFMAFARKRVNGAVMVTDFTTDLCRDYQYNLATRSLQPNTVRIRLAALGSLAKWAMKRGKLAHNPMDGLTRPKKRTRLPRVPRWDVVEAFLHSCSRARDRAIVALMAYGGLRRSEIVGLDVVDYAPDFGLRRIRGKGGHEAPIPLPEVARTILTEYLKQERRGASGSDPFFVVRYRSRGGHLREERMTSLRVWKLVKALGQRFGVPELHPHAFRHSCGTELLRRTNGNLRAVQEYLRHLDIQTTTIYTKLSGEDLKKVVRVFDHPPATGEPHGSPVAARPEGI